MRTALALLAAVLLCACNDGRSRGPGAATDPAQVAAEARAAREAQRACIEARDTLASALAASDAELGRIRGATGPEAAQALATAEAAHTRIAAEHEAKTLACRRLMRDPGSH